MAGIAGACLSHEEAVAYCGKESKPEAGGCAPTVCDSDEPIDLTTGACVPRLTLRKVESDQRIAPARDGGLGCTDGDAGLVVEGDDLACVPRGVLCGRGARWSEGSCHPDPACAVGSVPDPSGACVPVVSRRDGQKILDVGAWIRLVVGPDGGEGTSAVCGPLRERPWRAGVSPHTTALIEVRVAVVFPDNDVKTAHVEAAGKRRFDAHNFDSTAPVPVVRALEPVWIALRAIGGEANAASATTTVRCVIDGGGDVAGGATPRKEGSGHSASAKPPS
jgi:hypothetical protein